MQPEGCLEASWRSAAAEFELNSSRRVSETPGPPIYWTTYATQMMKKIKGKYENAFWHNASFLWRFWVPIDFDLQN